MTTTSTEKLVVYWLGYPQNPPAIQSLPQRIHFVKQIPPYNSPIWSTTPAPKAGTMEFNINDDANYQAADAMIKILSSQAAAAAG